MYFILHLPMLHYVLFSYYNVPILSVVLTEEGFVFREITSPSIHLN
jgi:hypothetical protein